jgi:cyclophilin family peptidyl-prolyl cis-trans isomerase
VNKQPFRLLIAGIVSIAIAAGIQSCTTKRKTVKVNIETTKGNLELELYESDAPKTVANFVGLAEQGYYNGVTFHRVSKNFVIQGGDPTGTGAGGQSIYGRPFEDELDPSTESYQEGYRRGTVAMANAGPNTNTSQFFILLHDAPWLDKNYTIFGRVIKGMEVVDSIAAVEIIPNPEMGPMDGAPKVKIVMNKVTVEK